MIALYVHHSKSHLPKPYILLLKDFKASSAVIFETSPPYRIITCLRFVWLDKKKKGKAWPPKHHWFWDVLSWHPKSSSVETTDFRIGLSDTTKNYHSRGTFNYLAVLKNPALNLASLSNAHEAEAWCSFIHRCRGSSRNSTRSPGIEDGKKVWNRSPSVCQVEKPLGKARVADTSIFIPSY